MAAQDLTTANSYTLVTQARLRLATDKANDDVDIDADDYLDALADALKQYNADRPRELVADLTGDGSTVAFSLEDEGWVQGFSVLRRVQRPSSDPDAEIPPVYLSESDYWVYVTLSGGAPVANIVYRDAPGSSYSARIWFTVPHTINGLLGATSSTVYQEDRWPVSCLATANVARLIQAERAKLDDDAAGADSLDLGGKSDTWGAIADKWQQKYDAAMTPKGDDVPAAARQARMVDRNPFSGLGWLTHDRS